MAESTGNIQFGSSAAKREISIQMAPLIDIVFLLICFYLLVAQLLSNQTDPTVQLPTMTSELITVEKPAEIVVNVRSDDRIVIDGRALQLDQVRAVIAQELTQRIEAGQAFKVVIRADRRQKYAVLDDVLGVCRDLHVSDVILRAHGGDE